MCSVWKQKDGIWFEQVTIVSDVELMKQVFNVVKKSWFGLGNTVRIRNENQKQVSLSISILPWWIWCI